MEPLRLLLITGLTSLLFGCGGPGPQMIDPPSELPPTQLQRQAPPAAAVPAAYPIHTGVTATVFWVGEPAAPGSPANTSSAWDQHWQEHFGGVDDPHRRDGYRPAGFVPGENPFYVALPYKDMPAARRSEALRVIPWARSRGPESGDPAASLCKNHWLRLSRGERTCCAQWEDVGPFNTNDAAYVFGTAAPRNTRNRSAGIDVSPAVRDALGLDGMGTVDWQFVDEAAVPDGPWKQVVTRGGIDWQFGAVYNTELEVWPWVIDSFWELAFTA
jgi:hypothetical protein